MSMPKSCSASTALWSPATGTLDAALRQAQARRAGPRRTLLSARRREVLGVHRIFGPVRGGLAHRLHEACRAAHVEVGALRRAPPAGREGRSSAAVPASKCSRTWGASSAARASASAKARCSRAAREQAQREVGALARQCSAPWPAAASCRCRRPAAGGGAPRRGTGKLLRGALIGSRSPSRTRLVHRGRAAAAGGLALDADQVARCGAAVPAGARRPANTGARSRRACGRRCARPPGSPAGRGRPDAPARRKDLRRLARDARDPHGQVALDHRRVRHLAAALRRSTPVPLLTNCVV